jgi:hypothetical protein
VVAGLRFLSCLYIGTRLLIHATWREKVLLAMLHGVGAEVEGTATGDTTACAAAL